MGDRRDALARTLLDIGAVVLVLVAVSAVGFVLTVWTGFPKGTDAYSHLTRLRFVAEFFPRHEWLYSWSAGMPTFESYPELPYLAAAPVTKLLGAPAALVLMARQREPHDDHLLAPVCSIRRPTSARSAQCLPPSCHQPSTRRTSSSPRSA